MEKNGELVNLLCSSFTLVLYVGSQSDGGNFSKDDEADDGHQEESRKTRGRLFRPDTRSD